MSSHERTTTRGAALKRFLVVAGGAAGVGVGGDRLLAGRHDATPAATVAVPRRPEPTMLVLHGRDWRVGSPSTKPGELPAPTDAGVPLGRLVDGDGRELGSFRAASLPTLDGAVELHTFTLDGGAILGIGPAGIHDKPFAIVGGTGRYTGASGTYVAKQSPRELGGDGTAEFTLTLIA
jgi:hypothetical protein